MDSVLWLSMITVNWMPKHTMHLSFREEKFQISGWLSTDLPLTQCGSRVVCSLCLQMGARAGKQTKHPFNESAVVRARGRHFKRAPLIWIKQEKVGTLYIHKALKGINPIICSIFNGHKVKNLKGSTLTTAQSILSILFLTFKSQGRIAASTAARLASVCRFRGSDPGVCVSAQMKIHTFFSPPQEFLQSPWAPGLLTCCCFFLFCFVFSVSWFSVWKVIDTHTKNQKAEELDGVKISCLD